MLNRRSFLRAMGAAAAVLTMPLTLPKLPRLFGAKPLVIEGKTETLRGGLYPWVVVKADAKLILDNGASVKRLDVYGEVQSLGGGLIETLNVYDTARIGFHSSSITGLA